MTDADEILGLMGEDDNTSTDLPVGLNINLSLSDDDLSTGPEYKKIPANTTTSFEIYAVSPSMRNGVLSWKVTFRAVDDTWGPKKQVTEFFNFKQSMAWKWGPFLKATGLIKGSGNIDPKIFEKHEDIEGTRVQARVLGYSWKGEGFPKSYGNNAKPIPTDGTAYYEDLGNFKPAPVSTDAEDEAADARGGAEFDMEDYL